MKLNTEVWIKLESVGRPNLTKITSGTLMQCSRIMLDWLISSYMGSSFDIRIARTEADLHKRRQGDPRVASDDISDLMAIFAQMENGQDEDDSDSPTSISEAQ